MQMAKQNHTDSIYLAKWDTQLCIYYQRDISASFPKILKQTLQSLKKITKKYKIWVYRNPKQMT